MIATAAVVKMIFFMIFHKSNVMSFIRRANLEKMEGKELAVVLHHLDKKQDTARRAVSEISMLQAQLTQQVVLLHTILHRFHFT